MSLHQHFSPEGRDLDEVEGEYLNPHPHHPHRRMMWATVVALACGAIGVMAGLLSISTDYRLDGRGSGQGFASRPFDYSDELAHDFASLEASKPVMAPPAIDRARDEATMTAPAKAADDDKRCADAQWPYLEEGCSWSTAAPPPRRHRKRIVLRLKSPWCSGAARGPRFFNCRS